MSELKTANFQEVAKADLIKFLLITFLVSWSIWIPMLLLSNVVSNSTVLGVSMIGVFAPTLTALYLVASKVGLRGFKRLFARLL